jgi:hypothetical protein
MVALGKQLSKARSEARNEKRKKARLVKKAAQLSPEDLKRIADLKRCGLWDPASGLTQVPGPGVDAAAAVPAAGHEPIATVAVTESAAGPAGAPVHGNPLAGPSPSTPIVGHGNEKASESEVEEKPE